MDNEEALESNRVKNLSLIHKSLLVDLIDQERLRQTEKKLNTLASDQKWVSKILDVEG